MRVRGLILALNRRGNDNILCTYHHGRDVEGVETVRIRPIRRYTRLEAGPSPYKYLADLLLFVKVCATIRRRRPDVIHGHLHEGSLIGWAAKWTFFWRRLPLIFDVQGSLVGELEAHGYFRRLPFLKGPFWLAEWLITRMPDHLVCSSRASMSMLRDRFSVPENRLTLIADGTDGEASVPEETEQLKKSLGLAPDRPVVIYTGALLEAKGLNDLCQLILAAVRDHLDCHFLVVGYPVESLGRFLAAEGISDHCTLTGRVPYEELPSYLALAQVAIEPKAADSGEASGKLLNYMASGLPVVCYDTPNNKEMLADGGYLAEREQGPRGLLNCLKQALASPREARRRGAIAKTRVEKEFSWDVAARCLDDIYQKVL